MKKIILMFAILLLAFSLNAFGQSSKRKSGVTHEDTWISKRKHKSTARTKNRKPIGKTNGICTGCCDPCYNDDVAKIRNQRRKHPTKGVKNVRKRTNR